MRQSVQRWVAAVSLIAMAMGASYSAWAQAVQRGPSIQFSNAKDDTVSTNANALTDRRRNNLKRLEEDLNRPLQMFEGNPGVGGNLVPVRPPTGPLIQSKKVRELLDRQKNWAFEKPEDQMKGMSDEEMMGVNEYGEDGSELTKKNALERYYEALAQRDAGPTNRMSDSLLGSHTLEDRLTTDQDSADPAQRSVRTGLGQSEQSLRQLVKAEANTKGLSDLGDAPVMPDLFDTKVANSWQSRAQESRLEQFRQTLQAELPKSAAASVPGLSPGGATLGSSFPGVSGYGGSGLNINPPPRPAATVPGSSSFSSGGLSAAPSLSPVSPAAYTPPAPVKKPPSLFTEMPRPRF